MQQTVSKLTAIPKPILNSKPNNRASAPQGPNGHARKRAQRNQNREIKVRASPKPLIGDLQLFDRGKNAQNFRAGNTPARGTLDSPLQCDFQKEITVEAKYDSEFLWGAKKIFYKTEILDKKSVEVYGYQCFPWANQCQC
jgi:hypothetical protein